MEDIKLSDYTKLEEYYDQILSLERLIPEIRPLHPCHTKNYTFYIRYVTRLSLASMHHDYKKIINNIDELLYEREYLLQPQVYYNILMFLEKLLGKPTHKKFLRKRLFDSISFLSEYNFAVDHINYIYDTTDFSINEKLALLKDLLEAVKLDLQYGSFTTFLYKERVLPPGSLFPFEDNFSDKENIELKNTVVYSPIYSSSKYAKCLIEPFKYIKTEHYALYYKGLNILQISEGKHHAAKSKINNTEGPIIANVININDHLNEIYSNGEKWYKKDTGEEICSVYDFRLPIVLYIYEKINNLEKRD